MRILVLTKSAIDRFRKSEAMLARILEYVRQNRYDKILLCSKHRHNLCSKFEKIPTETVTPSKLFKVLKNITREYKNFLVIAAIRSDERSTIESYLKSGDTLNMCFVNLDANQYESYVYTNIDLDQNFFSVKRRKYTSKSSFLFNVYEFPLAKIQ
ncbi:MAG: hypothetical protein LBS87_03025 [Puniceicoccales bacterium]|nr:hypothetical protein [Puniceicoccales bacterium]